MLRLKFMGEVLRHRRADGIGCSSLRGVKGESRGEQEWPPAPPTRTPHDRQRRPDAQIREHADAEGRRFVARGGPSRDPRRFGRCPCDPAGSGASDRDLREVVLQRRASRSSPTQGEKARGRTSHGSAPHAGPGRPRLCQHTGRIPLPETSLDVRQAIFLPAVEMRAAGQWASRSSREAR